MTVWSVFPVMTGEIIASFTLILTGILCNNFQKDLSICIKEKN